MSHHPRIPGLCAAVLCGGDSTRMGKKKALVKFRGERLLTRAVREAAKVMLPIAIVHRETERGPREDLARALIDGLTPIAEEIAENDPLGKHSPTGPLCEAIEDRSPNHTPLAGIEAALAWAKEPLVFIAAVDMPFVFERAFIEQLVAKAEGHAGAAPVFQGALQPLCAVIRKDALPIAQKLVAEGKGAQAFLEAIDCVRFDYAAAFPKDTQGKPFLDIDTPEDLTRLEAMR